MTKDQLGKILTGIIIAALILLLPLLVPNKYWTHVAIVIVIFILVASAVRSIWLVGEMMLGSAGFMMLGAYASALIVMKLGVSFWLALPFGGVFTAAVAAIVGYPFFRVKGAYFAILTLLLAEVFQYFIGGWTNFTGGWSGILLIPPPNPIVIPGILHISFSNYTGFFNADTTYYYLSVIIVGICLFILYRMQHARIGVVWSSIKESDSYAQALGVNIMAQKVMLFIIAGFFFGIAGGLYTFYVRNITPATNPGNIFSVMSSVYVVLYMVIGGEASFLGPIIGTVILRLIPEVFSNLLVYSPLLNGGLLIVIVFFMPKGLIGLREYVPAVYRYVTGRLTKRVPA